MSQLPIWTGDNALEVMRAALAIARTSPEILIAHRIDYGKPLSGKGEMVTIRSGDSFFVTTKPLSSSLVNDGSLWRTGPYAHCHCYRFPPPGEEGEEKEYFLLTVYRNSGRSYHIMTRREWHTEVHRMAAILREHAVEHWFH